MRTRTLVLATALLLSGVGVACSSESGSVSSGGAVGTTTAGTAPGLTTEDLAALKATREATSFQVDIDGFGAGPESLSYNAPDSYQGNTAGGPVLVVHGMQYERMPNPTEHDDPDAYFPMPLPNQAIPFLVLIEPGNNSLGPVKIAKVTSDGTYATEVVAEAGPRTVTLRFSKFEQVPSITAPLKTIPVNPSPDCPGPNCPFQIETSLPTRP